MVDPDVVLDDQTDNVDPGAVEESRRERRWYALLAVVLLLLLCLFCTVTSVSTWVTGGSQRARFIVRNLECLQCHTELVPDFSATAVHQPFAQKECTVCHTPHGKKAMVVTTETGGRIFKRYSTLLQWLPLKWWFNFTKQLSGSSSVTSASTGATGTSVSKSVKDKKSSLVLPETELCWQCHGNMGPMLGYSYTHQPFAAGRCTNCHNPHASSYKSLLTQAPNKICLTCHPMGSQLNRKQAHAPVAAGWCTDCHNPHASQYKGVLVTNQRDLCFRCHPTVAVKAGMAVQHQPFLNDNCTGCHEAHGSDYMPLLDLPQPKLCYKCHPKIADQFSQPSHHPVGVNLTCVSCHDAHAANYTALLNAKDNAFCFQCHSGIKPTFDKSKHEGTLCIRCHTPHGSSYSPMLRNSNPNLCLECHNAKYFDQTTGTTYRPNHPVRPMYYDVHARKGLTCTSSCHNPHGTRYNHMLKNFNYPMDGQCLQCHARVPGKVVGVDF